MVKTHIRHVVFPRKTKKGVARDDQEIVQAAIPWLTAHGFRTDRMKLQKRYIIFEQRGARPSLYAYRAIPIKRSGRGLRGTSFIIGIPRV